MTDHTPTTHGRADEATLAGLMRGRFLVVEGPDGSGKTTQYRRLSALAKRNGLEVCEVREPGGTAIGERVRDILLDTDHQEMALRTEMMLYMASRAQLVAEKLKPCLDRGALVLADRYVTSTLVYQGRAGGLPRDEIMDVAKAACGDVWPDLVLIYDVDEQTAASRLNPLLDRMESKGSAFHAKVRRGYLDEARDEPGYNVVIDATSDPDTVFARTCAALAERLA
ncbi:MAG: dTMP kinase [Phycisphaerales bacterium]